jgi:hypothetical protein
MDERIRLALIPFTFESQPMEEMAKTTRKESIKNLQEELDEEIDALWIEP